MVVADPDTATNAGFPGLGDGTRYRQTGHFTAIFEGNGHIINNLYSRNAESESAGRSLGLFKTVHSAAVIRNVGLTNVNIYGGDGGTNYVGALAGRNDGAIIASYASGNVHGGDSDDGFFSDAVGGLVGYNSGRIANSHARGSQHGGAGRDNVGGLVGSNQGAIVASYATGDPHGGDGDEDSVGGLVGYHSTGTITASYATGDPHGGDGDDDRVGGLVGQVASLWHNCSRLCHRRP